MSGRRWRSRVDGSLLIPALMWQIKPLHPVLRRAGVDIGQFDTIVRTKLLLDQYGGPKGSLPISGVYAMMMSGYWLFGLMIAIATIFIARGTFDVGPGLWLAATQTIMAVMLGLPLVTQYTAIFVDSTDIEIVGPTPVGDATLFASRLVHAALYTGVLAACVAFGPLVSGVFAYRWWAVLVVFPLATLLTVVLVVSGVGAFYGAALRIFGPRRFERLTLWIQVGLMSLAMGGGHLVMQAPWLRAAVEALVADPRLLVLVPTTHSGALLELLCGTEATTARVVTAGLALALPAGALWLAVRLAAKHFSDGLAGRVEFARRHVGWPLEAGRLLRRVARTPIESATIPMTTAMIRHDRMLVRGVWPQVIGMAVLGLAMPVVLLEPLAELELAAKWFAPTMFLVGIADVAIADTLRVTQSGEASWLLRSLEPRAQDEVARGALRAALLGVYTPARLVLAAILTVMYGPTILPHLALAAALSSALSFRSMRSLTLRLPFSLTPTSQVNQDFTNLAPYFIAVMAQLALGAAFGLSLLHWAAELALAAVALPWLVREYRALDTLVVTPESGFRGAERRPGVLPAPAVDA